MDARGKPFQAPWLEYMLSAAGLKRQQGEQAYSSGDEYVANHAEPHQNQASIVHLPCLVMHKSFWFQKAERRGDGDAYVFSDHDSVRVPRFLGKFFDFIGMAQPDDSDDIWVCYPEMSRFGQADMAPFSLGKTPEKLREQFTKLRYKSLELKFEAAKTITGKPLSGDRQVNILCRLELSREILSMSVYFYCRDVVESDPLPSFLKLYQRVSRFLELPAISDYEEILPGGAVEMTGDKIRILRQCQNELYDTCCSAFWSHLRGYLEDAGSILPSPFANYRGLCLNPRMYFLEPSWRTFFEKASPYTFRLNYRLSNSGNILPPDRFRPYVDPEGKEVTNGELTRATRENFDKHFGHEDVGPDGTFSTQSLDSIRSAYEAPKHSFDPDYVEQQPSANLKREGARLFLEAITNFRFVHHVGEENLVRIEDTGMHIPPILIDPRDRDPIASLISDGQAVLLSNGGRGLKPKKKLDETQADYPTDERRIDALPICFALFYIREQRRPICRILRRQIELAVMRLASLRYLSSLRDVSEELGILEREHDQIMSEKFSFVSGKRSGDGNAYADSRELRDLRSELASLRYFRVAPYNPDQPKVQRKESLIYRTNRSKDYAQTIRKLVVLQKFEKIPTWQAYDEFLNKRIFDTLDSVADLQERQKNLENDVLDAIRWRDANRSIKISARAMSISIIALGVSTSILTISALTNVFKFF